MWRKSLLSFAVVAALGLAAPAGAQQAAGTPTYSDSRMQDFARATVELQALGSQSSAAMTRAIEGAGMSVEDYNSMGDAMRADPALAASLNPYLEEANAERRARVSRSQTASRSWTPPARHAASAKKAAAHHVRGKRQAKAHKAAARGHHAAKSGRHTVKRTRHAAASHSVHPRHRKS